MYTFCYKVLSPRRQIPIGIFGIELSIFGIFRYCEYRRRCRYRYFKISNIGSVFRYTDPRLVYSNLETQVRGQQVLAVHYLRRAVKTVGSGNVFVWALACPQDSSATDLARAIKHDTEVDSGPVTRRYSFSWARYRRMRVNGTLPDSAGIPRGEKQMLRDYIGDECRNEDIFHCNAAVALSPVAKGSATNFLRIPFR